MAWTLGSVTLPNPHGFKRRFLGKETYHEAINGRSRRDISNRKEQYELSYQRIEQSTVAEILAQHALFTTLTFSAAQGSLNIAETVVHMDVPTRDYNTKGSEFREDFVILLTEVE
jgi:hypothetical protein